MKEILTLVHIKEFKLEAPKLGPEEVTHDIPNVSESTLRNLDEDGTGIRQDHRRQS